MFALALEAAQHDEQARRDLREAYETIFGEHVAELGEACARPRTEPPFPDELVSHAIMGGFEHMLARAALDATYSWRDIARTTRGHLPRRHRPYRGDLDIQALLEPGRGVSGMRSRNSHRRSRR